MVVAGVWVHADNRADMLAFQKFIQWKCFPLPSHTQFVEGGVKDSKRCCALTKQYDY
jgi:hypothetical protein